MKTLPKAKIPKGNKTEQKKKKQEKNYMAELPLCNFSPYPYMDFCELIDLTYGGKTPGIFECPI